MAEYPVFTKYVFEGSFSKEKTDNIFTNKLEMPNSESLSKALGKSYKYWEEIS
ncbi:MAG: hypothetical protein AB1298_03755 [Bacteroidota bacterium]